MEDKKRKVTHAKPRLEKLRKGWAPACRHAFFFANGSASRPPPDIKLLVDLFVPV